VSAPQASPAAQQRIQEQINPTFIASLPAQEDWYWGLIRLDAFLEEKKTTKTRISRFAALAPVELAG
jgi:hypothetical protein